MTFKKLHPESIEAGLDRNPGIVATAFLGMATSIPPHNAAELCDAALHLIDNPTGA